MLIYSLSSTLYIYIYIYMFNNLYRYHLYQNFTNLEKLKFILNDTSPENVFNDLIEQAKFLLFSDPSLSSSTSPIPHKPKTSDPSVSSPFPADFGLYQSLEHKQIFDISVLSALSSASSSSSSLALSRALSPSRADSSANGNEHGDRNPNQHILNEEKEREMNISLEWVLRDRNPHHKGDKKAGKLSSKMPQNHKLPPDEYELLKLAGKYTEINLDIFLFNIDKHDTTTPIPRSERTDDHGGRTDFQVGEGQEALPTQRQKKDMRESRYTKKEIENRNNFGLIHELFIDYAYSGELKKLELVRAILTTARQPQHRHLYSELFSDQALLLDCVLKCIYITPRGLSLSLSFSLYVWVYMFCLV